MTEDQSDLARIVSLGIEVFGAGVGAFVGTDMGPAGAAVAAMAGTAIGTAGRDIAQRVLSPRQEARVGAVFFHAGASIKAREVLGETLRDDGFFEGERSFGHEFAEGVMLVAKDSFEERKIPYLANLITNVAFTPTLDAGTANMAVRRAERLSWLEMCLLGIVTNHERFPLPDFKPRPAKEWKAFTARQEIRLMSEGDLLGYGTTKTPEIGLVVPNTKMNAIHFTSYGQLIAGLMQLGDIPDEDLRGVYELLTDAKWDRADGESAPEESTQG